MKLKCQEETIYENYEIDPDTEMDYLVPYEICQRCYEETGIGYQCPQDYDKCYWCVMIEVNDNGKDDEFKR